VSPNGLPLAQEIRVISHPINFFIRSGTGKRPLGDSDEGQNSKRAKLAGM